jgi:hypothetical protein
VREITSKERSVTWKERIHCATEGMPMFEFVLNLVFDVIIDWFLFFRRKKKVPE